MTTMVLITQIARTRNAEERSHLDLQVNLLAERRWPSWIALVEELRARSAHGCGMDDSPKADSMQKAVDPEAMGSAA